MLLVWRKKNDRNELLRFLILLLCGLTFFLLLLAFWPLAILLGLGVITKFTLKWLNRDKEYRNLVINSGFHWNDVEIYEHPYCVGFSIERAEFFAVLGQEMVRIKRRDILGFYFDNIGKSNKVGFSSEEIEMQVPYTLGSLPDDFQLVLQTNDGEFRSPPVDELEVEGVYDWVENCLISVCLGEFRCFAQNWREVLGVLQYSDELGFHQYQQGMRYLAIREISRIRLERNWSVEFEDFRIANYPLRRHPENDSSAEAITILTVSTTVYDTDGEIFAQIEEKNGDLIPEFIHEVLRIKPAILLEEFDRYVD